MFVVGISTLDLILKLLWENSWLLQDEIQLLLIVLFFLSILQERKKSYSFKMFLNYIQKLTVISWKHKNIDKPCRKGHRQQLMEEKQGSLLLLTDEHDLQNFGFQKEQKQQ